MDKPCNIFYVDQTNIAYKAVPGTKGVVVGNLHGNLYKTCLFHHLFFGKKIWSKFSHWEKRL